MALIVLLRGINVGGHRTLRPSVLARELGAHDVVNVGAAGTFVVRQPGSLTELRKELRAKLPATTAFVFCDGRDLLRLGATRAYAETPEEPGLVRFVSFLSRGARKRPVLPITIPHSDDWLVRVTMLTHRLAIGEYRRHMKTITCLRQLDTIFGTLVTTRSRSTVDAILEILRTRQQSRA